MGSSADAPRNTKRPSTAAGPKHKPSVTFAPASVPHRTKSVPAFTRAARAAAAAASAHPSSDQPYDDAENVDYDDDEEDNGRYLSAGGGAYSLSWSARTSATRVGNMADDEQLYMNPEEEGGNAGDNRTGTRPSSRTSTREPEAEAVPHTPPITITEPPQPEVKPESGGGEEKRPEPEPDIPQTPQTYLTFLTVSGKRKTMNFDPATTVGRVKELVWKAWPEDWEDEQRPPAPSYLRILYLGKILQDDDTLTKLNIPSHTLSPTSPIPTKTIVHLSIRITPPSGSEGDTFKKKKVGRMLRTSSTGGGQTTGPGAGDGAMSHSSGCCGSCIIC